MSLSSVIVFCFFLTSVLFVCQVTLLSDPGGADDVAVFEESTNERKSADCIGGGLRRGRLMGRGGGIGRMMGGYGLGGGGGRGGGGSNVVVINNNGAPSSSG